MGRGRAKAKQTKVARELKYSSHGTDLEALQRELAGTRSNGTSAAADSTDEKDEYEYEYDDWGSDRR